MTAVQALDMAAAPYDIVFFPLGAASYGGAERSLLELASAQARAGRRRFRVSRSALTSPASAAGSILAAIGGLYEAIRWLAD